MPGITERNKMKDELISLGYSMRYIDEWQPKTRLYRHKASYNVDGAMMEGVGTFVDNVPGSPDYVSRKARQGLLQWPPSESCTCRWCGGSKGTQTEIASSSDFSKIERAPVAATGKGKKKTGPFYQG